MNSTVFPTLKTDRLLLRQIIHEDIQNIHKGLSHPDVIRYYGVSFLTLEATKAQMSWFKNLEENRTGIWWAICSSEDGTFYGGGGFNGLSKEHTKAEIGFWLLPEFWGRGIMQEAFPIICNYGFDELGINRIEGFVESENSNCKKAMKKMNFILEGTMREYEIKDGRYIDIDIYSKLKND